MKKLLNLYLNKWWLPALVYLSMLAAVTAAAFLEWRFAKAIYNTLLNIEIAAIVGIVLALLFHLFKNKWRKACLSILLMPVCVGATIISISMQLGSPDFKPDEDHFADDLIIPDGLDISIPGEISNYSVTSNSTTKTDGLQKAVRAALTQAGNNDVELIPSIPALRRAVNDHPKIFRDYLDASPDWHIFVERGSLFASRRWSYDGIPKNTLHGYVSSSVAGSNFQTRTLLCLDKKLWSTYSVQKTTEGISPFRPKLSKGNDLDESFIMIDSGDVWLEIFEQSDNHERRITKATLAYLQKEFAEFNLNPQAVLAVTRSKSMMLAIGLVNTQDQQPFRLDNGIQPGIYTVVYSLNPQESGWVYLKAYEVTNNTPLSVNRLKGYSMTRVIWSPIPTDRFGSKAGFTIYEGDWGKPYAARFEVWFEPDSGKKERILGERNYKIEGWQR